MLSWRFNASRALGCRSPRAPLKHTHPHLSAFSGLLLCFNARQVPLLPHFGPKLRPWRTIRTASATLRPVFAPVAVLPDRCGCSARGWSCPPHLRRYCDCGLSDFRKESGTLLGPLTEPERVFASRLAAYCKAVVLCPVSRRTWLRAAATPNLVCIYLTISTLLIFLGSICAEDFQEITDNQRVINQLDSRLCAPGTD